MVSAKFAQTGKIIARLAESLKKVEEVKPTGWAMFVKSGPHRTRPPQPDFWYTRSASILRRIYIDGPVGVERLRTYYGARRKRGYAPAKFKRSSGNMTRKILQQLEKAGYLEKLPKGGRIVSAKGRKFLDQAAKVAKDA